MGHSARVGRAAAIRRRLVRLLPVRITVRVLVAANELLAAALRSASRADPTLGGARARLMPRAARVPLESASPAPALSLDEIPSETSEAERRFLFTFFAGIWSGAADAVEIGPYLGGTTRAIALGMLANPARGDAARLHVFDRFAEYHEPAELLRQLEPLFEAGLLAPGVRTSIARSGSFADVFDALHAATPYAELIDARAKPLPDVPEERGREDVFELGDVGPVEAFFVDGCKSWYATKHFALHAAGAATPGAWMIFQDYGWYTCFWLPVLTHALGDALALRAYVDSTYAFQLTRPLEREAVERRFADAPEGMDLDRPFVELVAGAVERGDRRAEVVHELQHAAALAYVGKPDRAREMIARARRRYRLSGFRSMIDAAASAPTYRPGGGAVRL